MAVAKADIRLSHGVVYVLVGTSTFFCAGIAWVPIVPRAIGLSV